MPGGMFHQPVQPLAVTRNSSSPRLGQIGQAVNALLHRGQLVLPQPLTLRLDQVQGSSDFRLARAQC
jgi:hypothetical protein